MPSSAASAAMLRGFWAKLKASSVMLMWKCLAMQRRPSTAPTAWPIAAPEEPNCASDLSDPTQIFSSPAVFGGLLLIGHTAGAIGYRGAIEALDAGDGSRRWRFEVDPILNAKAEPILDRRGHAISGINRGCGAVWSSAAVDPDLNLVFFGIGDCNRDPTPP